MHEVLVSRLGGLSLPRKTVVRITDHPDMTLDVYRGRKTTIQQQQPAKVWFDFIIVSTVFQYSNANRLQVEIRCAVGSGFKLSAKTCPQPLPVLF